MTRPDYARPGGPWDVEPLSRLTPPAVVDPSDGTTASSAEIASKAHRLATAFAERGVQPGDVVAFQLPNWWETLVCYHACWRLGAVAFPIHHRGGASRRASLLRRAEPRLVLCAAPYEPGPGSICVRGPDDGFRELLDTPPDPDLPHPDGSDLAVLLATSGSTGSPKLVRHAHRGLAGKGATMVEAHGLRPDDTVLMPAPMAHVSGLLNGILVPGSAGMTTVVMEQWDPPTALGLIRDHRVSFMIGPPTFFVDLATAAGDDRSVTASLRLISSGGSGVTPAFVDEASERFSAVVKRTYGSTEAPTVTTWHVGDRPAKARDTDGRPTTDVEVRIVDPGSGSDLPVGAQGELLVRGPELFVGYDAATHAEGLDPDGWFATGDLARLDDDGFITIVGRVKDTIIRGGENISPAAVEAVCATLPGVRQCAVVGVPDDRLGERVGLVVEADAAPALDEVQRACEAAGLERFAWPELILALDALPVLDAGKPDRKALTERFRTADR